MSKKRSTRPQTPQVRAGRSLAGRRVVVLVWVVFAGLAAVTAFVIVPRGSSGAGAPEGALASGPAPAFSERDVVSGRPLSTRSLRGKNILLFFSEGVMCQACFQQIQALQQATAELRARGLTLVSITTDSEGTLGDAAQAYGVVTPLVSDADKTMSSAYGAIGVPGAMHSDNLGHTFILVDKRGQIRWREDYAEMYVPPEKLFDAIPEL